MNQPSTSREAFILEALGEVSRLLDRVDLLKASMKEQRKAIAKASSDLDKRFDVFEAGLEAITYQTKTRAIDLIARRTSELAMQSVQAQSTAMNEAARAAFAARIDPTLDQLMRTLRQLVLRANRPWEAVLTHAAVAVSAAAITWVVSMSFPLKEVARLFTDGRFQQRLEQEFEGKPRLRFHLAPPTLGKRDAHGHPLKQSFGPWVRHGFKLLASLRGLRGTPFDIFGRSAERREERQLIDAYRHLIDDVLARWLDVDFDTAVALARLPEQIRGFGHVKQATQVAARVRWQALLPKLYPSHSQSADLQRSATVGVETDNRERPMAENLFSARKRNLPVVAGVPDHHPAGTTISAARP